ADWTDNDNNGAATMYQLSPTEFDYILGSIREDYPAPALYTMMNLMDSHDTNRALFVLDEASASTADAVAKLKMMAALQFTYIGSPTIYYGDEAALGATSYAGYGLWGAGYGDANGMQDDPYNRHTYPWDPDLEDDYNTWTGSGLFEFDSVDGPVPPTTTYTGDVRAYYQILGLTRSNYPVLRSGDVVTLLTDDANNVYAYARVNGTDCALAIFNRSTGTQNVTLNGLPAECTGTFFDVLNGGAAWTVAGNSLTVNGIAGLSSAVLVTALGINGLELPPAVVETTSTDIAIDKNTSTPVSALVFDVAGQALPAGVTVNFTLVSGGGSLSSTSAVTDGLGIATVTYTGENKFDVAVIQASITAPNGVTYSSSIAVFVGFKANATNRLSVNTGIGPHFVDGFTAGLDVAATKVGTGEPVVSLGQYDANPYKKGNQPVASTFVDVNLTDVADVEMLAIRVRYTDEIDEDTHQLYWWDGKGWIATSPVYVDVDLNEVTLEVTNATTPSLNDLTGSVMVVGDPGYYDPNAPAEDDDTAAGGGGDGTAAGTVPDDVTALPSTGYAQETSRDALPVSTLIAIAFGGLMVLGGAILFWRRKTRI
ncbi:MAG: hypothetical protein K8S97_07020, partial [Anaerolineae bacterium]|nr:hypothetical protein [Anaerolineae bacterium]